MTKGLVNNTVVALVINGNDRLRTEIGIAEAEDLNIFCRCKMLEQCRDFTLAIDIKLCLLNQFLRLKAVIL